MPPHADPMNDVFVDALQIYVKATKEQIAAKKLELERAGYSRLLDDNAVKGTTAAPPTDPPAFSAQESSHPAPPQHPPTVETPNNATGGGLQDLSGQDASGDSALKPVSNPAPPDSTIPSLTLKKANTTAGTASSKVQTYPMPNGATLAVFSVHENHIVNSSSRQWVSDCFFFSINGKDVEFRVQFVAKQMAEGKKGHSFKKANGQGKMELKCAGEPPEFSIFKVAFLAGPGVKQYSLRASGAMADDLIGGEAGDPAKKTMDRRETPTSHDFGKYPTFGLTGANEYWNFGSLLDKKKNVIHVGVEMIPQNIGSNDDKPSANNPSENTPNDNIDTASTAIPSQQDSQQTAASESDLQAMEAHEDQQFRLSEARKAGLPVVGPPPGLEMEISEKPA